MATTRIKKHVKISKVQTRGDEVSVLFFSLLIFIFLVISLTRFSIIGKVLDDFCFTFLFGWVKYLLYLISFIIIIPLWFNYRIKITIKNFCFTLLLLFMICWTTQTITLLVTSNKNLWTSYQNLNLVKISKDYFNNWWNSNGINHYNGFFGTPISFKDFTLLTFFPPYATGGMISNVITGFFNYGFFATAFLANLFFIFIFVCYLCFSQPFILFTKLYEGMIFTRQKLKEHKVNRVKKKQQIALKKEKILLEKLALEKVKKEKKLEKTVVNNNSTKPLAKATVPTPVAPQTPTNENNGYDTENSYLTPFGKLNPSQQKANTSSSKGALVVKKSLEESLLNNVPSTVSKKEPTPSPSLVTPPTSALYMPAPIVISKDYELPKLTIPPADNNNYEEENKLQALENQTKLASLLKQFNINGQVNGFHLGSAITKYEVSLTPGIKVNKITSLEDNIKLTLGSHNIRIEAPIPGKSMVGIETPNKNVITVHLQEVMKHIKASDEKKNLLFVIGKDSIGNYVFQSLAEMPHLLIAGTTGSGKSVFINTFLISLLMRYKPHEVKLVLIDPKWVELVAYNDIPHLLTPVINDANAAVASLKVVLLEMERRYQLLARNSARNIDSYNKKVTKVEDKLPYYVVIIDELADLMVKNSKEIEEGIMRITQMGRAAGIHLVVATQRPSTDIITGVIKNNIAARVAFKVSSWIDSRTVIDSAGAEKLMGKGDMLFNGVGNSAPIRIQAPWISEEEVTAVIEFIKQQSSAQYDENFMATMAKIK